MPYRADTLIMRICRHCFRLSKYRHPGSENNGGGTCHEKGALPFVLKIVISLGRTFSLNSIKNKNEQYKKHNAYPI